MYSSNHFHQKPTYSDQFSSYSSAYSGSSAAANQSRVVTDWKYTANWRPTQDSHSGYHRSRYRTTRTKDIDVSPLLDVLKRIDDIDTSIDGRRKTKFNDSDSKHSSLFKSLDVRREITDSRTPETFPSPRWPSSNTEDDDNEFSDDVQWPSSKDDSDTVKDVSRDKRQIKKQNTGRNIPFSAPVLGRHNACTDIRSDLDTMDGISNFSSEEEYDGMLLNKDGLVGGNSNGAEDETNEDLYTGDEDDSSNENTTDDVFSQSSDDDFSDEDCSSEEKDLEPIRTNDSSKERNVQTPASSKADGYRASIDSFDKLCDDLDTANSDSEGSELCWRSRDDDFITARTSREYDDKSVSGSSSQFENDSVISTPLAKPSKLFSKYTRSAPVTRKSSEKNLFGDSQNQNKMDSMQCKKPVYVNKTNSTKNFNENSHLKIKTVKSPETVKQDNGVNPSCGVSVAALRAAMEREIARANAN